MENGPYLHLGELSVLGIARLAQVVNQCRIDIYQGELKEESAQQALFEERLADWREVPVWVERWMVEERACFDVFLSEGEMLCATQRFRQPRREGTAHMLCPPAETPSGREASSHERMTLGGLIASTAGRSALASRLDKKCVAPYEAEELEALDLARSRLIWTWDNGDIHPTALLCLPMQDLDGGLPETLPLCLPSAWGKLDSYWHGGLHLHAGHVLVVCDETGQYGLVRLNQVADDPPRVIGRWVQPCTWAWLAEASSSGAQAIEAARHVVPDARGELVCDLIDALDERQVNPPGVKGLLGTSHYFGTDYNGSLVVNEAGHGSHTRVLGRITRQGVLLCGQSAQDGMLESVPWGLSDLRWLEIGQHAEGMIAVRSPENGLWGYMDRCGALVIKPQYESAGDFQHGTAVVLPAGDHRVGLIDKTGQWVLLPRWHNLQRWSRQVIVAETLEGHWGAVDVQGRVIVSFEHYSTWLDHPEVQERLADYRIGRSWRNDPEEEARRTVIEVIATIWKREFREKIRKALHSSLNEGGSLAGLEGLFDGDTSERDLREGGIWGLEVVLLRDKTDGLLQPRTAETGRIGCYYPVSLSIFDLSTEAPVHGLPTQPEAAIGIPWRDLTPVISNGTSKTPQCFDSAAVQDTKVERI